MEYLAFLVPVTLGVVFLDSGASWVCLTLLLVLLGFWVYVFWVTREKSEFCLPVVSTVIVLCLGVLGAWWILGSTERREIKDQQVQKERTESEKQQRAYSKKLDKEFQFFIAAKAEVETAQKTAQRSELLCQEAILKQQDAEVYCIIAATAKLDLRKICRKFESLYLSQDALDYWLLCEGNPSCYFRPGITFFCGNGDGHQPCKRIHPNEIGNPCRLALQK
jgi:hypothetical protein